MRLSVTLLIAIAQRWTSLEYSIKNNKVSLWDTGNPLRDFFVTRIWPIQVLISFLMLTSPTSLVSRNTHPFTTVTRSMESLIAIIQ